MEWPAACLASYLTGITMDEEFIIKSFQLRNLILLTHPEFIGCKNLTHETSDSLSFFSTFSP